jgi:hypothetical protein
VFLIWTINDAGRSPPYQLDSPPPNFPDEQTEYANGVLQAVSDSLKAYSPRLWAYEVYNSILMGFAVAGSAGSTRNGS